MQNQNDQLERTDQQNDHGSIYHRGEVSREREHHHQRGRRRSGHGPRDFWREWRHERHDHGTEIQVGQALSPQEMEAWREFFFKTFGNWPEEHWIFGGRRFRPWHQGMDSFNPFVANLLSKGGGLLPLYVLQLVAQKPRYGNEIMDLITEQTAEQWGANPGAIYPLMNTLEEQGLIEGTWDDPTRRTVRVYNLTEFGEQELRRLKAIVRPKLVEAIKVMQNLVENLNAGEEESSQE